ncbi:LacI family transcriptional regulator [Nocardioides gansuensis]|uniref:LacI family transcriptional regulator n=2 Tax=Nocardioides gansuensis TaxID=2138300 RepID=A0A2T8FEC8_9ACTN|nr:LacI family transcriptional regulator [Nocardioides gansuensis]
MHDVARHAGVSVSTVSYVLTGARPISPATRKRVLAAMAELDYQPNAMARGLASRRSRILGLLMPMDDRGTGATETAFVTGAAEAAARAAHHLLLSPIPAGDVDALRRLASQRILDGALVMEVQMEDPRVEVLRELGVPFVLIGRTRDTTGVPFVDIDFDHTVRGAVEHLLDLGHRSIVFVNHSQEALASGYAPALRTQESFTTVMAEHGLEPLVVTAEDTAAAGRAALRTALVQCPGLSAVLAMNEHALFGVLGELALQGLKVPDDVSVVSMVTSAQVADLATPALTTMTSPGSTLGRLAVEVLLRTLEGSGGPSHQELVTCSLEVRGSSGHLRRTPERTPGGVASR